MFCAETAPSGVWAGELAVLERVSKMVGQADVLPVFRCPQQLRCQHPDSGDAIRHRNVSILASEHKGSLKAARARPPLGEPFERFIHDPRINVLSTTMQSQADQTLVR